MNGLLEWTAPSSRDRDKPWPDDAVLNGVTFVYQRALDPSYSIDHRPDQVSRNAPAVDGILVAPSQSRIAVEITQAETYEGQRRTQSLVADFLRDAERRLSPVLPPGVTCELPVHPFQRGSDWKDIVSRIEEYISSIGHNLQPGAVEHHVPGVPFPFWVGYTPGSILRFRFERADPPPEVVDAELVQIMTKALRHKSEELRSYKEAAYRTSLVITSADRYLVSWHRAYRLFREAERLGETGHIDDVLFALTGDTVSIPFLVFKGDVALRNAVNPHTFSPDEIGADGSTRVTNDPS